MIGFWVPCDINVRQRVTCTSQPAFDALGATVAESRKQIADGCANLCPCYGDFWVAIFILTIDRDIGVPFDALIVPHNDLTHLGSSSPITWDETLTIAWFLRSKPSPSTWVPASGAHFLTSTASFSSLAVRCSLNNANPELCQALDNNSPGPQPVVKNGAQCVRNEDLVRILAGCRARPQSAKVDDAMEEDKQDAWKMRKAIVSITLHLRVCDTSYMAIANMQSQSQNEQYKFEHISALYDSTIAPPHSLSPLLRSDQLTSPSFHDLTFGASFSNRPNHILLNP
ncbi:hypothetical protein BKA63DRAFT_573084 [Paraphoma chrysanthemicola]|nr:hypothetical protein BKA63DRAFT_573084 [Paraphoma chrysanthemicola]